MCLQSLVYEIAPFSIRLTLVQPNLEAFLHHKMTFVPSLSDYKPAANPALSIRDTLFRSLPDITSFPSSTELPLRPEPKLEGEEGTTISGYPSTSDPLLLRDIGHTLISIGGHPNPPIRHVFGFDAIETVREKLRGVTEEMEEFLDATRAVDIQNSNDQDGKTA